MAESDLGPDFLLDWAVMAQPGISQGQELHQGGSESPEPASDAGIISSTTPNQRNLRKRVSSVSSRLSGESEERRERRLRQARECSSRRRSTETAEQREKRLKEQRERMALKRRMESPEVREARLKKAREREMQRRRSEPLEQRDKRLKYSREKAAMRRDMETPEQRERRLDLSRMRAAQRRMEKKHVLEHEPSSTASDSTVPLMGQAAISPASATPTKPPGRKRRTTRRSTQQDEFLYSDPNPTKDDESGNTVLQAAEDQEYLRAVSGLSTSNSGSSNCLSPLLSNSSSSNFGSNSGSALNLASIMQPVSSSSSGRSLVPIPAVSSSSSSRNFAGSSISSNLLPIQTMPNSVNLVPIQTVTASDSNKALSTKNLVPIPAVPGSNSNNNLVSISGSISGVNNLVPIQAVFQAISNSPTNSSSSLIPVQAITSSSSHSLVPIQAPVQTISHSNSSHISDPLQVVSSSRSDFNNLAALSDSQSSNPILVSSSSFDCSLLSDSCSSHLSMSSHPPSGSGSQFISQAGPGNSGQSGMSPANFQTSNSKDSPSINRGSPHTSGDSPHTNRDSPIPPPLPPAPPRYQMGSVGDGNQLSAVGEMGVSSGDVIGGMGFLERRYDHPDFRYNLQHHQRPGGGQIQAVVVRNMFT